MPYGTGTCCVIDGYDTVPPCQKLVFNLEEVPLADVHLEGLVDDGKP